LELIPVTFTDPIAYERATLKYNAHIAMKYRDLTIPVLVEMTHLMRSHTTERTSRMILSMCIPWTANYGLALGNAMEEIPERLHPFSPSIRTPESSVSFVYDYRIQSNEPVSIVRGLLDLCMMVQGDHLAQAVRD
jgi:hypothetical protein